MPVYNHTLDSSLPEQVHISPTESPNVMRVKWVTLTSKAISDSVSRHRGCNGGSEWTVSHPSVIREYVNRGLGHRIVTVYWAEMSNLQSGSKYCYQVGSPSEDVWSQVFSFTPLTDQTNVATTYLFYADFGVENSRALPLIKKLAPTVDLIVEGGDQGYDLSDNNGETADEFARITESAVANTPYVTVAGNHEAHNDWGFTSYIARYPSPNPSNPHWWSFNHGLVHWVGINTDLFFKLYALEDAQRMIQWLISDLTVANTQRNIRPWIFVVGHHPLQCIHPCKSFEADIVKQKIQHILQSKAVDMYLTGHVHGAYLSRPMSGVIQLLSGAAGCREPITPHHVKPDWVSESTGEYSVTRISVLSGRRVHIEQLSATSPHNKIYEQTITKSQTLRLSPRFSSSDILNLVRGVVSKFSSNFHWVTCAGDAYTIYTDTSNLMHQLQSLKWGQWKTDTVIIKNSLKDISGLLRSLDSAMTACDIVQISEAIGKACAKLSGWIGEIDEAVTVATHIIDFVEDSMDIVHGVEQGNWFEVGQGVGGLIQLLA